MAELSEWGVCASTASACMGGRGEPSYVLKAMGLKDREVSGAVRFSLGRYNTPSEIEFCVEVIGKILN